MKIHSDVIGYTQTIRNAATEVPGVIVLKLEQAGSRSRSFAFEVRLGSDGTPDQHGAARNHAVNGGTSQFAERGADAARAASYADWGHFLGALFAQDADLIAGPYKGAEDFHAQTKGAFRLATV